MSKGYVLRDLDENELARLHFQHRVWHEQTAFALHEAGLNAGDWTADLGCGPGYLAEDLAQIVGTEGNVFAIDNSAIFIEYLKSKNLNQITAAKADLRTEIPEILPTGKLDAIFCRWVLMFIGNVQGIVTDVLQALKPGGRFISIEYFRFHEINMFPGSVAFRKIYDNVHTLLTQHGGNPDIGGQLPGILHDSGFRKVSVFPVYRTGKPGSPLWQWLEGTNANHSNLVEAGLITQQELDEYFKDWEEKSSDLTTFITAPPLMITVGVK